MTLSELQRLALDYGTDDEYRAFIQRQRSCISDRFCEQAHGEGRNPACHVRRANDSGTGIKPLYDCVPMTHQEHALQSEKGEVAVLIKHGIMNIDTVEDAKWWFDQQVKKYLLLWFKSIEKGAMI